MKRSIMFLFVLFSIIALVNACSKAITAEGVTAVSANDFLNSIGVNTHICQGQSASRLVEPLRYTGIRGLRDGGNMLALISDFLMLHQKLGIRFCVMDDDNLDRNIAASQQFAEAGALIAVEGPNEPNNWPVTYQGEIGGGNGSWLPLAKFQMELYQTAKRDPVLKNYPVFSASEMGAQTDNVGLQFLTIPAGAGTLMPDGTKYADYANVHNYIYHDSWPGSPHDNQVWNAADPGPACKIDGLYNNHGSTWRNHFKGYSEAELLTLPRVCTETGTAVGSFNGAITEEVQGNNYMNLYLANFKRGWKYTFIYEFTDDRDGAFGFYKIDYTTARKSAHYLHNLTTILADTVSVSSPGKLKYSIPNQPETTHDLLLQKSNGKFELVIWSERVSGSDDVIVNLGRNYSSVKIYDLTLGTSPAQTLINVSSVTMTMSDHPVIIEID